MLAENTIVEHHLLSDFFTLKCFLRLCKNFLVLHFSFELSEHRVSILVVEREFLLNFSPLRLFSARRGTRSDFDRPRHPHSDRRPASWLGVWLGGVVLAHSSGCFVPLEATGFGKRSCVGVKVHLRGAVESVVLRRWLDTRRQLIGVNLTEIYGVLSGSGGKMCLFW